MSEKLLCNIRNVKRPIVGLIPGKRIVRDELGIELACRQYMRIKRDCNVFAVINGDEYIIPTGEVFNKYLEEFTNNPDNADVSEPVPETITEEKIVDNESANAHNNDTVLEETSDSINAVTTGNVSNTTTTIEQNEQVTETVISDAVNVEEAVEEETTEDVDTTNNQNRNSQNRKNKKRR